MHNYLIALISACINAHAQDDAPLQPEPTIIEYQSALMRTCFDPVEWMYDAYFKGLGPDPCEWWGVECTNGIVDTLLFSSAEYANPAMGPWAIENEYLPSTLRYTFLTWVHMLGGWRPERLPREARFFSAFVCIMHIADAVCILQNLPTHLEELHLVECEQLRGKVLIAQLPPAMRFCRLTQTYLKHAYVNSQGLPKSLELLELSAGRRRVKVAMADDGPLDARISNKDTYGETKTYSALRRKSYAYLNRFDEVYALAQPQVAHMNIPAATVTRIKVRRN